MVPVTCDRSSEVLPLLTFFLREERNKFLKQFQSCSALRLEAVNHFVLQNNSLIPAAILEKIRHPPHPEESCSGRSGFGRAVEVRQKTSTVRILRYIIILVRKSSDIKKYGHNIATN